MGQAEYHWPAILVAGHRAGSCARVAASCRGGQAPRSMASAATEVWGGEAPEGTLPSLGMQ